MNEDGFSLIELLMVLVILGILAAIVVFAVSDIANSSARTACQADLKNMENAVSAYKAQMGNFPNGTGSVGQATDSDPSTVNAASATSGSGAELLTGSEIGTTGVDQTGLSTPNLAAVRAVGAWIKEVPTNGDHYFIWVANDGSGDLFVGKGPLKSDSTQPAATSCSSIG